MVVNLRESGLDGAGAISSDLARWLVAGRFSVPFSGSKRNLKCVFGIVLYHCTVQRIRGLVVKWSAVDVSIVSGEAWCTGQVFTVA
jgi:hypothetical protein